MNYRADFPIFDRKINDKPIVYLDSAATTQKPSCVIDAISEFYKNNNANIHRGIYKLSEEATDIFESTRKKTAQFFNSRDDEIVFTKNATESLNIMSATTNLKKGDEIVATILEHHSSLIPLQRLAKRTGAVLKIIDSDDDGNLKEPEKHITDKTRIVASTGMSNVLGTIPNLKQLGSLAHDRGALFIIDAAQLAGHRPVDVKKLGCDALAASSHKMLGPAGTGILWAKNEVLRDREPFLVGGGMIAEVSATDSVWADSPQRFEAGTLDVAGIAGFGAALDYLSKIGMDKVGDIEKKLSKYASDKMNEIEGVRILGSQESILSFVIDGIHPHDIATVLDTENVCIRAGHHCAMPLMKRLGVHATSRASFHVYNTREDIDLLIQGLKRTIEVFS